MAVNMCLAVNGGTLADSAAEGDRDGDWGTAVHTVNHQGGGVGYCYIYLYYNGDWQRIDVGQFYGTGDPGWSWNMSAPYYSTITGPWSGVTGLRFVIGDSPVTTASIMFPRSTIDYVEAGTQGNGNADVVRSYISEMQAWGVAISGSYGQII